MRFLVEQGARDARDITDKLLFEFLTRPAAPRAARSLAEAPVAGGTPSAAIKRKKWAWIVRSGRARARLDPAGHALSVNTLASYARLVANFTAWLTKKRELLFDPALSLPEFRPERRGPPVVPTIGEVERLIEACPIDRALGIRTRTLLELLYGSALRIGEVVKLTLSDLDLESGRLTVRAGKGGKDRVVPMSDTARLWVARYLESARPLLARKNVPTNALFLSRTTGRPIGKVTATLDFRAVAAASGLPIRLVTHSLRHAAATHLLAGGCDLGYIAELLGHADLTTTQRYTAVEISELSAAHARSHPTTKKRKAKSAPRTYRQPPPGGWL